MARIGRDYRGAEFDLRRALSREGDHRQRVTTHDLAEPRHQKAILLLEDDLFDLLLQCLRAVVAMAQPDPHGQDPFKNSMSAAFVSSGRSCCVQWPAPGNTTILRKSSQCAFMRSMLCGFITITPSLLPWIKSAGCLMCASASWG